MTVSSSIPYNITVFPTNDKNKTTTKSNVLFEDQSLGHVLIGFDDEELLIELV